MNNQLQPTVSSIDSTAPTGSFALKLLAGFAGVAVVPALLILSVTFAGVAAALPLISLSNLFGLSNIPFNLFAANIVGLPQLALALVTGMLFLFAADKCYRALKRYFGLFR